MRGRRWHYTRIPLCRVPGAVKVGLVLLRTFARAMLRGQTSSRFVEEKTMKNRMMVAAALVVGFVLGFGLVATSKRAEAQSACGAKGAACTKMDGSNPEPDDAACCSGHCSWSNGDQKYECE